LMSFQNVILFIEDCLVSASRSAILRYVIAMEPFPSSLTNRGSPKSS
jgi:hypothetical protein